MNTTSEQMTEFQRKVHWRGRMIALARANGMSLQQIAWALDMSKAGVAKAIHQMEQQR